jgi:hypothetical protein
MSWNFLHSCDQQEPEKTIKIEIGELTDFLNITKQLLEHFELKQQTEPNITFLCLWHFKLNLDILKIIFFISHSINKKRYHP